MSSNESDSDAPDDVLFSAGRADALLNLEIAKSERKRHQDSVKEWRRKRDALYKKQKDDKKLSMEVLMKADAELKKSVTPRMEDAVTEEDDNDGFSDNESSDEESKNDEEEKDANEENQESDQEDGYPEVAVKVLHPAEPLQLMQSALAFKSSSLYGGRIKRMKMSQVMKRKTKQNTRCFKGKAQKLR